MKVKKDVEIQFLNDAKVFRLASRILENREIANVRKLKSKFMGQLKNGCKMKETDYSHLPFPRFLFPKTRKKCKKAFSVNIGRTL